MPLLRPKPVEHKYGFVFCTSTCATGLANGLTVRLRRGDVWAADDPVVTEHEAMGLFIDEPDELMLIRSTPPEVVHIP